MKESYFHFLVLFNTILLAFTCLFQGTDKTGAAYSAKEPDKVLMNAVIVSDTHASDTLRHDNNKTLTKLFAGIGKSRTQLDAIVIPGDLTQCALPKEYAILSAVIGRYHSADAVIPALGNHDVRGDYDAQDYEANMANYYAFCRSLGVPARQPYWSVNVNGYLFIVLGAEAEEKDRTWFSDAQLQWLDGQLAKAERRGKPAFIVNHQVIDHTNDVDRLWYFDGSIGGQSEEVEAIIRRHTEHGLPVIFISGHLHAPFSEYTFEQHGDNLYCLNVPSVHTAQAGQGCTLECYADRVLIRARNFITGEWLPDAYTVTLN
ncbi:MAG: metallophosphoesterase [Clostridia bacterium]|nr:metallophosphoesterase [Clostridia bacterium]